MIRQLGPFPFNQECIRSCYILISIIRMDSQAAIKPLRSHLVNSKGMYIVRPFKNTFPNQKKEHRIQINRIWSNIPGLLNTAVVSGEREKYLTSIRFRILTGIPTGHYCIDSFDNKFGLLQKWKKRKQTPSVFGWQKI